MAGQTCTHTGTRVTLEVISDGFNTPTMLTHPGDGTDRVFVADQIGEIYVIEEGIKLERPFLSVADRMVSFLSIYYERGLLGLAFHPEYAENGRFFVCYSGFEGSFGQAQRFQRCLCQQEPRTGRKRI